MPKRQKPVSKATDLAVDKDVSLDDLRFLRDLAQRKGNIKLMFKLAVAIDKKKGLY